MTVENKTRRVAAEIAAEIAEIEKIAKYNIEETTAERRKMTEKVQEGVIEVETIRIAETKAEIKSRKMSVKYRK